MPLAVNCNLVCCSVMFDWPSTVILARSSGRVIIWVSGRASLMNLLKALFTSCWHQNEGASCSINLNVAVGKACLSFLIVDRPSYQIDSPSNMLWSPSNSLPCVILYPKLRISVLMCLALPFFLMLSARVPRSSKSTSSAAQISELSVGFLLNESVLSVIIRCLRSVLTVPE